MGCTLFRPGVLRRGLAGRAHPHQFNAVAGDKKPASPKTGSGQRPEQAPIRRLDGPAALADRVIMVLLDQTEMSRAVQIDLLDEPRGAQALHRAVDGD